MLEGRGDDAEQKKITQIRPRTTSSKEQDRLSKICQYLVTKGNTVMTVVDMSA